MSRPNTTGGRSSKGLLPVLPVAVRLSFLLAILGSILSLGVFHGRLIPDGSVDVDGRMNVDHLSPPVDILSMHISNASAAVAVAAPFYASWEDSTILVTIAFGNVTQTHFLERWVWSLRTMGGWTHGRVAVFTDQYDTYQQTLQSLQKTNPTMHAYLSTNMIWLPAKPHDLVPLDSTTQQPIVFKKEAMRYKRFKNLILTYLDEQEAKSAAATATAATTAVAPYRLAIYLDVDIVVTRPLSGLLQDYQDQMIRKGVYSSQYSDDPQQLHRPRPEMESNNAITGGNRNKPTTKVENNNNKLTLPFMSMFTDCPTCARGNTNGGFFILHRVRSRPCLEEWNELFLGNASWGVYDQRYLRDIRANGQCQIHVLPDNHRLYPTRKDMRLLLSATIVHNTQTYNAKSIPAHVQATYFTHLLNTTQFSSLEFFD